MADIEAAHRMGRGGPLSDHSSGPIRPLRCGLRTWQWATIAIVAMTMAAGGCGGCGGCGGDDTFKRANADQLAKVKENLKKKIEKDKKKAAESRKKVAEAKAQKEKKAAEKKAEEEARRTAEKAEQEAARGVPVKPKLPKRPKDIAEWKEDDYLNALAESDPRLMEAVKHLGQREEDQEGTTELLNRLLRSGKGSDGGPSSAQTQAILEAMAASSADTARDTLEQIVAGELTVGGKYGKQAALKVLASYPAAEYEAAIFRTLTNPAGRPMAKDKEEKEDGEKSDAELLESIQPEVAESFRVRLAEHILAPTTNGLVRERLAPLLEVPRPDNLAAQVHVFRQFHTPAPAKAMLAEYFSVYGSETLRLLMGIPQQGFDSAWNVRVRGGRRGDISSWARAYGAAQENPDLALRAVSFSWTKGFADHVGSSLYHLDSLDERPMLVVLASTIPLDTARSSVYRALERNWQDGPKAIEAAGLPKQMITDPALLVSVKVLLHEILGPKSSRKPAGRADVQRAKEKVNGIANDWAGFCGQLVLATNKRLELAARARDAARKSISIGSDRKPSETPLPLTLHDSARVVARYRSVWPEDVISRVPGAAIDAMRVDYVRIEEMNRYQKLLAHYRRQLGSREEVAENQGVWMTVLRNLPESGRKLSLDVVVRRAATTSTYETLEEDEKLTVEILAIEVRDPNAPANDQARESANGRVAAEPGR